MEALTREGITTILPVKNMDRARTFYKSNLGLKPLGFSPSGNFVFEGGKGSKVGLIAKDEGTKAEHTALTFEVHDIADVISQLQNTGIEFEDYDLPELKTVNHICTMGTEKAAWFKDTEGNFLCVHEILE